MAIILTTKTLKCLIWVVLVFFTVLRSIYVRYLRFCTCRYFADKLVKRVWPPWRPPQSAHWLGGEQQIGWKWVKMHCVCATWTSYVLYPPPKICNVGSTQKKPIQMRVFDTFGIFERNKMDFWPFMSKICPQGASGAAFHQFPPQSPRKPRKPSS